MKKEQLLLLLNNETFRFVADEPESSMAPYSMLTYFIFILTFSKLIYGCKLILPLPFNITFLLMH